MKKLAQIVLQEQQVNVYKTIGKYVDAAEKHFKQARVTPDDGDLLNFVADEIASDAGVLPKYINKEILKTDLDKVMQSRNTGE